MSPQRSAALAAFQAGARTYLDIQHRLGITPGHARVLVYNLVREGAIEPRGRLPKDSRGGRRALLYEVVV